jgi:hypothetical protein
MVVRVSSREASWLMVRAAAASAAAISGLGCISVSLWRAV